MDRCNCPLEQREDQFQIVNNWTKTIGNHAVKFGADLRYARNLRVPSDNDRTGINQFGTGPTSNPADSSGGLGFATFVLGDVTNYNRYYSTSNNNKEFQKRDFFYVQDTWRATQKLTLNLGVRYELYFPEAVNAKGIGSIANLNTGYFQVAGYGKLGTNMGFAGGRLRMDKRHFLLWRQRAPGHGRQDLHPRILTQWELCLAARVRLELRLRYLGSDCNQGPQREHS